MEFSSQRHLLSLSACGIVGITFMFYMHGMVLDGWWLDSRDGVMTVAWAVAVITALVTVIVRSYLAPVALWMGLVTGMAMVLWLNGLGSIWPIVLAVGGVLLCAFVAVGAAPIMLPWFLWKQVKAKPELRSDSAATNSRDRLP
jgi:hypothetical protein